LGGGSPEDGGVNRSSGPLAAPEGDMHSRVVTPGQPYRGVRPDTAMFGRRGSECLRGPSARYSLSNAGEAHTERSAS
jgi:hypothetical protein